MKSCQKRSLFVVILNLYIFSCRRKVFFLFEKVKGPFPHGASDGGGRSISADRHFSLYRKIGLHVNILEGNERLAFSSRVSWKIFVLVIKQR